jgi:hypothetical protein
MLGRSSFTSLYDPPSLGFTMLPTAASPLLVPSTSDTSCMSPRMSRALRWADCSNCLSPSAPVAALRFRCDECLLISDTSRTRRGLFSFVEQSSNSLGSSPVFFLLIFSDLMLLHREWLVAVHAISLCFRPCLRRWWVLAYFWHLLYEKGLVPSMSRVATLWAPLDFSHPFGLSMTLFTQQVQGLRLRCLSICI